MDEVTTARLINKIALVIGLPEDAIAAEIGGDYERALEVFQEYKRTLNRKALAAEFVDEDDGNFWSKDDESGEFD